MAGKRKAAKTSGDPLFVIKLQKGLADRQRLPLSHVLSVLDELRQLVAEIGRDIQRKRGFRHTEGDFGLELVAGEKGIAFQPGSVQASVALTERAATGVKAVQSIIETVGLLESEDFATESSDRQIDRRIVRRLARIAKIQRRDKTEMNLGIHRPGNPFVSATFGSNAISAVRSLQAPTFRVSDTIIYGRLTELTDRTKADDDDGVGFWGELHADDGDTWRVHFKPSDLERVTPLFRKQVQVTGTATYFRIAHPKLACDDIQADKDRDLERAFDELFGCYKNVYKADLQTLIKRAHEE